MEHTFLTRLNIHHVRHLENITIPLSLTERKNLILTGKNGSGKTSVLVSFVNHLEYVVSGGFSLKEDIHSSISRWQKKFNKCDISETGLKDREQAQDIISNYTKELAHWTAGCTADYTSILQLREKYRQGQFILAYYSDNRKINVVPILNSMDLLIPN